MLERSPFSNDYLEFIADAQRRFGDEGRHLTVEISIWDRLRSKAKARRQTKPWRSVLATAVAETVGHPGLVLEFGVHKAHSTNFLAGLMPNVRIHGFDSFQGFPDDGREDWQSDFALNDLPVVASNVQLHQGFFDETLPPFVAEHHRELSERGIRLLNVDCDIYSSTVTVLEHLEPYIKPGLVIMFDEFINYDRYLQNEILAFYEYLKRTGRGFKWCVTIGKNAPLDEFEELSQRLPTMRDWRDAGYYQTQAVRIV